MQKIYVIHRNLKKKMKFNINTEKEGTKVILNYHLLKINDQTGH